jgi:hypothetical protein
MTQLLKRAFEKASKLPDAEQDALAAEILAELEGGSRWDGALGSSADAIDEMGRQALKEYQQGKTMSGGFDNLRANEDFLS